jgi:3-dehydroquinate synthase
METRLHGRDGDSLVVVSPIAAAPLVADVDISGTAASAGAGRRVIVTEPEVLRLHGGALPSFPRLLVPRGEAAKSFDALEKLFSSFLEAGLDRASTVIAFGGGAVSDLAGFAASIWLRGIAFEYIPTTLLAMVDAAVGGKTGIDFRNRKNLIGTFCQPRRVLCDVAFLDTLSDVEFSSGMAEVIKHSIITGGEYASLIEGLGGRRPRSSEGGGRGLLERIVGGSILVKAAIVSRDERESGERRLLNLGHTIGHAVESVLGLPHGHSVAAGIACACRLSASRGAMDGATLSRILSMLAAWSLPSSIDEAQSLAGKPDSTLAGARRDIAAALVADKKRDGTSLNFALPRGFGSVEILSLGLDELTALVMETP